MCGIIRGVVKIAVTIINIALFIAGGVMLGIGIWLLVDDGAAEWLGDLSPDIEFGTDNTLWTTTCSVIITVGAILFVVGFCGCCGVMKESRCLLLIYIILVSLCIVLEVVAIIIALVFNLTLTEALEKAMKTSVTEHYSVNQTSNAATTVAWNNMQFELECCGAVGPEDWQESLFFADNNGTMIVPYTCCAMNDSVDGPGKPGDVKNIDECYNQVDTLPADGATVHLYQQGCAEALFNDVSQYMYIIAGVCTAIIILEIFGICVACNIRNKSGKVTSTQ